jgi:hypothetical protein
LGIPVIAWTSCWLDIIAAMVCLLCCVRRTPPPLTPPLPAHACSTPRSAASTTAMVSLDGSHASVSSVLMSSPSHLPRLLSQSLLSCCAQAPCVSDASDLVSDDLVPIPCLCVASPLRPSDHAAETSLADSAVEVPIQRFPPRSAQVPCDSDDEGFYSAPYAFSCSLLFPSLCSPSTCPSG